MRAYVNRVAGGPAGERIRVCHPAARELEAKEIAIMERFERRLSVTAGQVRGARNVLEAKGAPAVNEEGEDGPPDAVFLAAQRTRQRSTTLARAAPLAPRPRGPYRS